MTGKSKRTALMGAVFSHLGDPSKPVFDAPAPIDGGSPPPPPPDGEGPKGNPPVKTLRRVSLRRRQSLRNALKRGLKVAVGCNSGCELTIDLRVSAAARRRYGLPSRIAGTRKLELTDSDRTLVRVKFSRRARRKLAEARALNVVVRATQTDVTPRISRTAPVKLVTPKG